MLKRVQHDGRVVTDFTRFAAIDWSGAKGRRHKGIAIAACGPGDAPPELIAPGHVWSRREVLDWLRERAADGERWLIGMDFSFAPPRMVRGCYLPGEDVPGDARGFWAYVDAGARTTIWARRAFWRNTTAATSISARLTGRRPISCTSASASRSEEHTSELQSLMRISYAVFCLKKKRQ